MGYIANGGITFTDEFLMDEGMVKNFPAYARNVYYQIELFDPVSPAVKKYAPGLVGLQRNVNVWFTVEFGSFRLFEKRLESNSNLIVIPENVAFAMYDLWLDLGSPQGFSYQFTSSVHAPVGQSGYLSAREASWEP